MENGARVKKKRAKYFAHQKRWEYYSMHMCQSMLSVPTLALPKSIEYYLKRLRQSVGTAVIDWDLSDFLPNQTFCLYSFPLYLYETSYIP